MDKTIIILWAFVAVFVGAQIEVTTTAYAEQNKEISIKHNDSHKHENEKNVHEKTEHSEHEDAEKDEHNHSGEDESAEHEHAGEHEHGHSDEESKTEISPKSAKLSGVKVQRASNGEIITRTFLTGRIVLDGNNTAIVRARFPGLVKKVYVNLGDRVVRGQKLALVESNESLKTYHITAPIAGIVLSRETNVGDVTNDKALFKVADLSTVWAKYHVFPLDIDKIKKNQKVSVATLDEATHQDAQISMLFPLADALSQTVIAIAAVDNSEGQWRPGMTVEGAVETASRQADVVIPKTALQFIEGKQVVFVQNGNVYEAIPVTTGIAGQDTIEIRSGLKKGDLYVSEGSFVIKTDLLKATAAHAH